MEQEQRTKHYKGNIGKMFFEQNIGSNGSKNREGNIAKGTSGGHGSNNVKEKSLWPRFLSYASKHSLPYNIYV
jgi:hypothetical protein